MCWETTRSVSDIRKEWSNSMTACILGAIRLRLSRTGRTVSRASRSSWFRRPGESMSTMWKTESMPNSVAREWSWYNARRRLWASPSLTWRTRLLMIMWWDGDWLTRERFASLLIDSANSCS
ncbi:antigenic determinant of rec-A protein, mRNA isoform X1 [Iris pallida]|uniref:Antigenic determinant of rec-A protein, mRNA isoform X1 n=1 Tax=Iris pallida TaxID=29817 RepID=A0AAX6GMI0_IRIPA|nr:antigenic determinant of rec-A protein, mRNA isoform X1 [Iris pallida]KAJ6829874.1 antigenic determinant of rec-A protein, mRNA isoform X1 [Iris pallida]